MRARAAITASGISANSATGTGGGIDNSGTLAVGATTLSGNSGGLGGGIASSGTLTVGGSTLSGNAAGEGGGIYDVNGQDDLITNTTFAGNSAAQGGGIYASNSTLSLVNATVAYNTLWEPAQRRRHRRPPTARSACTTRSSTSTHGEPGDDVDGTIGGFNNLIGSTGPGGLVNGVNGNQIGVTNPGLAPALAGNGGPTKGPDHRPGRRQPRHQRRGQPDRRGHDPDAPTSAAPSAATPAA